MENSIMLLLIIFFVLAVTFGAWGYLSIQGRFKYIQSVQEEDNKKILYGQRLFFQLEAIPYLKTWIEIMKESEEKEIGLQWLITKEKTSLIIEWRFNRGRSLCEKFQFHQYSNTWKIEDEEMALKDWQLFLSELS